MSLKGGALSTPDATLTTPGLVVAAVPPSGSHPVAMGRFSGAYYEDQDGITIVSGQAGTPLFVVGDIFYDTDNYLQAGIITVPFSGYYRITMFVYSDQLIAADYHLEPSGGADAQIISGHGTTTVGINASCSQTMHKAAGDTIQVIIHQYSGADQLMFGGLQVEYIGPG